MRRTLSRLVAFVGAVAVLACLLMSGRAAADQQCHPMNDNTRRIPGLFVGVRLDAAGYRNSSYQGNYEGIAPLIAYSHRRFSASMMLPAYRLDRNGRAGYGLGDLALAVRAPMPQWSTARLTAGFGVSVTLPTGSAANDLGMGHVMLMPEFWWTHLLGRVQLLGSVGFGRALMGNSTGAHHHGSGPRPIVNPMNLSEVEASFVSYIQVHRLLALKLGFFGAMPVGSLDPAGVTRISAAQGLVLNIRGLELAAELQTPLTGAPFSARGVLMVGYRFDVVRRHKH